jgi:hypothetical protein
MLDKGDNSFVDTGDNSVVDKCCLTLSEDA